MVNGGGSRDEPFMREEVVCDWLALGLASGGRDTRSLLSLLSLGPYSAITVISKCFPKEIDRKEHNMLASIEVQHVSDIYSIGEDIEAFVVDDDDIVTALVVRICLLEPTLAYSTQGCTSEIVARDELIALNKVSPTRFNRIMNSFNEMALVTFHIHWTVRWEIA